MRHLFLSRSDYAGSGALFADALSGVGEKVEYLTEREHPYCYPWGRQASTPLAIRHAFERPWDVLWLIQSDFPDCLGGGRYKREGPGGRLRSLEHVGGRPIVLLHGGSDYRRNRATFAEWFAGSLSLCYEADLMGAFEYEHLCLPPCPLRWLPERERPGSLTFGHFPSRPADKGSAWICPMMERAGVEWRTSVTNTLGVHRMKWPAHIQRVAACDVVIDQIQPTVDGQVFGEWVSLATEAAGMGCITIANSLNPAPYVETYGRMPGIRICNTPDALAAEVERIKILPVAALRAEQDETREWVAECHNPRKTAELCLSWLHSRWPALGHP